MEANSPTIIFMPPWNYGYLAQWRADRNDQQIARAYETGDDHDLYARDAVEGWDGYEFAAIELR